MGISMKRYANALQTCRRVGCLQGPTDKTTDDFWRMIWQTKARSIVMLCNTVEQGKKKCEQYWPANAGEVVRDPPLTKRVCADGFGMPQDPQRED